MLTATYNYFTDQVLKIPGTVQSSRKRHDKNAFLEADGQIKWQMSHKLLKITWPAIKTQCH